MDVILASGSPRRKGLLELAGIDARVLITNADETGTGAPEFQVREFALRKLECAIGMLADSSHTSGGEFTLPAILSAEKKITFRRDLGLLPTENSRRTMEDVFRREYNTSLDAGRVNSPPVETFEDKLLDLPPYVIIAADTLVYIEGKILAKPATSQEAFDMLKMLEGAKHTVYTGVAMAKSAGAYLETYVFASSTDVFFRSLTDDEIHAYIKTGEPFDKAGAYGVQEKGALLVEKVVGDFYTVVGLPLARVCKVLSEMGVDVWKV